MKFSLLLILMCAGTLATSAKAQVIIIANPALKASDVSKSDVQDVFSGTSSSFKDGAHLTPVLMKSGAPANDAFLAYIGKADAAFRLTWRSLVFSGQATMPRSLESESAVVEFVARTPGAVGYISKATPHEGVKVVATH